MKKDQEWSYRGDYKVTCDVCGKVIPRSQAKKRWDGILCCFRDWETRNISDHIPPFYTNEGRGVKDARPLAPLVYTQEPVSSDNFLRPMIWGDTRVTSGGISNNAIWGGLGDPTVWGD